MELIELKRKVHEACMAAVEMKMKELHTELAHYQSAANEETKSSAGDKYETGRAMMHLEKEKLSSQLNQLQKMAQVLHQLRPDKSTVVAELGSLVRTNHGYFYLSVSLGKLDVQEEVFCISPVAPLGQALKGASSDQSITFGNQKYQVLEIS